jgi:diguanylate cyclase (GGDEF)-like protein
MTLVAALIYWVIVALWTIVLGAVIYFYVRNPRAFGTTRLLLAVLAVDTFRNIFENVYFGLYFGGQYGLFSQDVMQVLGQPWLLIVPKVLNVIAALTVLGLLLCCWMPLAVKEWGQSETRADTLQRLAAVDHLTGLYNRRTFEALAFAELARCQRYMRPFSVLLLDIDDFKRINDQYGHATGDRMLIEVANLCRSTKRDSDVVARMGGDEIAMLLPETTREAAVTFAKRICEQMRSLRVTVGDDAAQTTLSIGVAGASHRTTGVAQVIHQADEALYEAKRGGRDQVFAARPMIDLVAKAAG